MADFAAFPATITAGVRVATAFVTDDRFADIIVATPKGVPNSVRVFDGARGKLVAGPVAEFSPYGAGDTRGIYIAASNDPPPGPPDAVNDEADTNEDETVDIYWLPYNDTDPNLDTVTVTSVTQPAHGTVTLLTDKTARYTPAANWSGSDSFTYTATDGTNTDTASVTVTVRAVDDDPSANAVTTSTTEDTGSRSHSVVQTRKANLLNS